MKLAGGCGGARVGVNVGVDGSFVEFESCDESNCCEFNDASLALLPLFSVPVIFVPEVDLPPLRPLRLFV